MCKLERLFGDTNIDNVDNITIILAVHDYIKNSKYCKNLQISWQVSVLVMCKCVCYCAYFINVNKLYLHVCVLERAKHSFFALPNPLSYFVMNKICLNQVRKCKQIKVQL